VRPLFRDTVGPIQHQIRPFARAVQKPLRTLNGAAHPLSRASTGLTKSFGELNKLFNALAYNPPGSAQEGYLFWLAWLNHDTNSLFFTQDAGGPLRHGLVLGDCNTLGSAEYAISPLDQFLNTLRQLSGVATYEQVNAAGGCS
jgi:phospholipid/cholesterol/gamma-HCH transport system substrate-binding protein